MTGRPNNMTPVRSVSKWTNLEANLDGKWDYKSREAYRDIHSMFRIIKSTESDVVDTMPKDEPSMRSVYKKLSSITKQNPRPARDVVQEYTSIVNISDIGLRAYLGGKTWLTVNSYEVEFLDKLLRAMELIQKKDELIARYKQQMLGQDQAIRSLKKLLPVDKSCKRGKLHPSGTKKVDEV